MILRHLCSTIPARRSASSPCASASLSSQPRKPDLSTRGRLKPLRGVSIGTRLSAARLSRVTGDEKGKHGSGLHETKTRRKPPSRRESDVSMVQHPEDAKYSFQPVRLYPVQMALHLALNPPHMPLPVHLGTTHYHSTDAPVSSSEPFIKSAPTSLSSQLAAMEPSSSGFREHLNILDVLPPHLAPSLFHQPIATSHSKSEFPADLARTLAEAGVRNRVTSEYDWGRVLTHLGDKPSFTISEDREDVDAAVASLHRLLGRLFTSARGRSRVIAVTESDGEERVRMDSTQRKRRKKISKHKYKKRRKAQRALRKRLGK